MKPNKLNWEVGAGTETGYVRKENQDRMSWAPVPWGQLYIVADGMGGHAGGAQAAELTVQGLEKYLATASEDVRIEDAIRDAFEKTNKDVYDKAHAGDPATEGMGSTAVILLIFGQIAKIAHVGDSRAYLYRDGKLRLLTKDHTQVQRMVDAGMLTPEAARNHPSASLLERAIGHRSTVAMDIGSDLVLKEGDGILLCSDGLSGYADDQEIEAAMNGSSTPQETVNRLINLALQKGGEDNVTVQFVRYGKRSEVRNSDYKGKLKSILLAVLIAGLVGATSFSAYMLATNSTEESDASLRKAINRKGSELMQQITKIKEPDEQIGQHKVNVADHNLELVTIKNAEQQSANQIRKLENQLGLESQAIKSLENKLKSAIQQKSIAEKRRLSATQMVKKLEEKVSALKKKVRTLEKRLQLFELAPVLCSPVNDKEGK
ncbi:MAG: protein phosphatase 2C domain-containing protein [Methylococcales bacterium]|nr:protein phosphatase 2C domain-containing protein [Methylococcales bacterium]